MVSRFMRKGADIRTAPVGVINGGSVAGVGIVDADDLRDDATDLGRSVELAFALAAFGSEVTHQVFVGISENVVAFGAVFAEIQRLVFEDSDQIGEPIHHFLATAQLGGIVKVGHTRQLVGIGQRPDDLLVDLVADIGLALERDHILETGSFRDSNGRKGYIRVFVADVFHKQHHQHVILVLAGIHPAAKFIATGPE